MAPFRNYLISRYNSFGFAFKGIATLLKEQPHARLHLLATCVVCAGGFLLGISKLEWAAVCLAMGAVWGMEAMNTAIEYLTDLVSPNYHPLAGKAKDVAAAAVLLTSIAAAIVGVIVFLPKIKVLLF